MNVPQRYRLPIAILASLAMVLLVFLAVTSVSQPRPNDTSSPTPSASPSASVDPTDSPESVVRAFFDALARARRTDDPNLLTPFVTSTDSSAYLTAAGFLEVARDPASHPAQVNRKPVDIAGAILVWGAIEAAGRADAMATYGLADVVSIEDMLRDLRTWDAPEWRATVERYRRWTNELFDALL